MLLNTTDIHVPSELRPVVWKLTGSAEHKDRYTLQLAPGFFVASETVINCRDRKSVIAALYQASRCHCTRVVSIFNGNPTFCQRCLQMAREQQKELNRRDAFLIDYPMVKLDANGVFWVDGKSYGDFDMLRANIDRLLAEAQHSYAKLRGNNVWYIDKIRRGGS